MPANRDNAFAIVRYLRFHVASLAFACVLLIIMTISGPILLLSCLLVKPLQYAQKLTEVLWRLEVAISALVAREDELVPLSRQCRSSLRGKQDVLKQRNLVDQEHARLAILPSLVYFLVLKWLLTLIFSAVPLLLWAICLAHCLPTYTRLSALRFKWLESWNTQGLTQVACVFLAFQVSIRSARGLLYASRKGMQMILLINNKLGTKEQVPIKKTDRERKQLDPAGFCNEKKRNDDLDESPSSFLKGDPFAIDDHDRWFQDRLHSQLKCNTSLKYRWNASQDKLRRCKSLNDVLATNLSINPTLSDAEDDFTEKEAAHQSVCKASSLSLSTRPPWVRYSRQRSCDALENRAIRDEDCGFLLRKCWSEPRLHSDPKERKYTFDSNEVSSVGEFITNQRFAFKKPCKAGGMEDEFMIQDRLHNLHRLLPRKSKRIDSILHDDIHHGVGINLGVKKCKIRDHRKMQKYAQKLIVARRRIDKQNVRRMEVYIEAKERDRDARNTEHAADESHDASKSKRDPIHRRLQSIGHLKASTPRHTAQATQSQSSTSSAGIRQYFLAHMSGGMQKRALSSRSQSRPSPISDHNLSLLSNIYLQSDKLMSDKRVENQRSNSTEPTFRAASSHDSSDFHVHDQVKDIAGDDDVTELREYVPLSYTSSSPEYTNALDSSVVDGRYSKHPDYDTFSPMSSPKSSAGSLKVSREYDLLSPTHSNHDADFSTDKFQQVYRSIHMAAKPDFHRNGSPVAAEASGYDVEPELTGQPGRRDRVNFSAFAPPSVCPSPTPFQFTVWAFLLSQRFEMQELAQTDHPASRKLSLESKLNVRRGALVHVTLEVPTGFEVHNGATQGFAWTGTISSVDFDVVCTERAAFGRVLFKARITVGSSVAVLNSFVLVGSRIIDPSELEANVCEGWMDVMEQTYREIPFQSLEIKELVGKGYFGDAYRAVLDGEEVVVKTIRASEFGDTTSQIVREFQHEAAMLNMFGHHPCIVPFVGASTDTTYPLALVTQYFPYGNLETNLRTGPSLSIDERTGMLKDAAAGLLNIHEGGFIHRDLAARNCLVDQGNHVRICDFGLCRRVRSKTAGMLMKNAVGPVKYMAPESLQPPYAFSYDSDVYMFGVLMWETFTSSRPFASMTPVEAMMHVLRGERLAIPNDVPKPLQTLMQKCFHDSPAQRPSMQQVLTALDDSLVSSTRASAVITTSHAIATATAAASTAMTKSTRNVRKEHDRSIWV